MMKLKSEETVLLGHFIVNGPVIEKDGNTMRIEWLISNYLLPVAISESGWEKLYQDPEDKRYWELTYPEGEMQGGGAPKLEFVSIEQASQRYNL